MRKSLCVWITTILPAIMFGMTSPTQTTAMTPRHQTTHADRHFALHRDAPTRKAAKMRNVICVTYNIAARG